MSIQTLDIKLIHFLRRVSVPFARFGLFVVFFWFGMLKIVGQSPAGELVRALYEQTISFMPFDIFYILFAILEVVIGILFLIPHAERIVIPLLLIHMATTFLPLIFLPDMTWQSFFVLTLEGQYIVKNLAIIAAAIPIAAHMHPMSPKVG